MEKKMLEIKVVTFKGDIFIEQPAPFCHEADVIRIKLEQVDVLINWLEEAKAEIKRESHPEGT